MEKKIWIACTDDWELKGNGLGDVETLQYVPSLKLMDLYEECGIRSSFNVEVLQQLAFEKYRHLYPDIERQHSLWLKTIETMIQRGFDVQLHIHPQWHEATFDGQFWKLDKRWNLADYQPEEIHRFVKSAHAYLSEVVKGRQKLSSFRGGSWGIVSLHQPSRPLMQALEDVGIQIEISICNGLRYQGEAANFDYSLLPCPYTPYYPDYDDPRQVSSFPTKIIEIPTQSVRFHLLDKVLERLFVKLGLSHRTDPPADPVKTLPDHIMTYPFGPPARSSRYNRIFDVADPYPLKTFQKMTDKMIRRAINFSGEYSFLVLQNHTKNLRADNQFEKIKQWIGYIQAKWGHLVRFVTLQEMADHVSLVSPALKKSV